jgi:hypothetical protein
MTRYLAAVLAAFACLAAHAQGGMRVQVLAVESLADFERWAQQMPRPMGEYPRGLREVPVGKPVHFPILVSGLQPGPADLDLVADIEFYAPGGKSLGILRECCRFFAPAGSDVRMAVLGNAATLVFGENDLRGTYSARVSVKDGPRSADTRQDFAFNAPRSAVPPPPKPAPVAPSSAAEAPKLRMGTPPAKNPGRDADKRDCLSLPTPAEVIKCAERK